MFHFEEIHSRSSLCQKCCFCYVPLILDSFSADRFHFLVFPPELWTLLINSSWGNGKPSSYFAQAIYASHRERHYKRKWPPHRITQQLWYNSKKLACTILGDYLLWTLFQVRFILILQVLDALRPCDPHIVPTLLSKLIQCQGCYQWSQTSGHSQAASLDQEFTLSQGILLLARPYLLLTRIV